MELATRRLVAPPLLMAAVEPGVVGGAKGGSCVPLCPENNLCSLILNIGNKLYGTSVSYLFTLQHTVPACVGFAEMTVSICISSRAAPP